MCIRDRGGIAAVVVLGAVGAFALLPRDAPTPSSAVSVSVPPVTSPPTAPPSGPVASPSTEPSVAPPTAAPSVSMPPTIESLTGLIVFSAVKGDNGDLWIWDPADDSLRALVTGPASQTEPAWSPDGTAIVYRAPGGLRMIRADGDRFAPPEFTAFGEDRNPAWSSDGRRIVFSTTRQGFATRDVVSQRVNDPRGKVTPLATSKGSDYDPIVSPDGSTIVFVSTRNGGSRLFLMDADGGRERALDLGKGYLDDPMFSPDGEWIAYTWRPNPETQKDVFVVRVDGSDRRQLTDTPTFENDLAWSPDGRVIATARLEDGVIVLLDAETGDEIGTIGVAGAQNLWPDWWWPGP